MILRLLSIEDLLKLFDDNMYQPRVIEEFARRWRTTLAFFVPDPESFRSMMRTYGALVGGPVALWFATSLPGTWRPDHLDLLVPQWSAGCVKRKLLAMPGFALVSGKELRWEMRDQWLYEDSSYCVWTTRGVIRVVHSIREDALALVANYWGTHLMNVLSADAFVAPYMRLTMGGRAIGTDIRKAIGEDVMEEGYDWHKTPEDPRGYRLYETGADFVDLRRGCYNFVGCCQRERTFTDNETLLVQIGRGGEVDVFKQFRRSYWGWKLKVDPCANKSCFFERDFTYLTHWVEGLGHKREEDMCY